MRCEVLYETGICGSVFISTHIWSRLHRNGSAWWCLLTVPQSAWFNVTVTSPNRFLVLMVAVATVTGEVVLATALTFAAFFSDLSVVPGLIQSSYPSSEWMDVSVVHRAHNRMKRTAVLALEIFWYKRSPWTVHLLFFSTFIFSLALYLDFFPHSLSLTFSHLQFTIVSCRGQSVTALDRELFNASIQRAMFFGLLYKLCIWWGNNKLWQLADLRPCPKTLGAVEVCVSIAEVQDKWAGGSGSKKAQ